MTRNGSHHSAFVDSAGAVWTVGSSEHGQLGHGNNDSLIAPERVPDLPSCSMVACGARHTVCLSADGRVFCFGRGSLGQLGQNLTQDANTPQEVAGLPLISQVACGVYYTMCVGQDGSLWGFGDNRAGQLGLGHTERVLAPTCIKKEGVRQTAGGFDHTLILTTDGHLLACGSNKYGQLGLEGSVQYHPTRVVFDRPIHSVHCGSHFSMVLATDHTVWTTGHGIHGKLGLGDRSDRTQLTAIPGLTAKQVACGQEHAMAIDLHSRLWAWGSNKSAQLGIDQTSTPAMSLSGVASMNLGYFHSMARTTDDRVLVCGCNAQTQLSMEDNDYQNSWSEQHKITRDMMTPPRTPSTSTSRSLDAKYWQCKELEPSQDRIYEIAASVQQALDQRTDQASVNPAPLWLGSWKRCADELEQQATEYQQQVESQQMQRTKQQAEILRLRTLIPELQRQLAELEKAERDGSLGICKHESRLESLQTLQAQCMRMSVDESQRQEELLSLLSQKPLCSLECDELSPLWWRMSLNEQQETLQELEMNGRMVQEFTEADWQDCDLSAFQAAQSRFVAAMCRTTTGLAALQALDEEDCVVCSNNTVSATINLMRERGVSISESVIREGHWIAPLLVYAPLTTEMFQGRSKKDRAHARAKLRQLQGEHEHHLSQLNKEHAQHEEPGQAKMEELEGAE